MEYGKYLLLQVNDALFPIGGYSHSYGLETYIQMDIVNDLESAAQYLKHQLLYSVSYSDLLAVRLAYEYTETGNKEKLFRLEDMIRASKVPREVREAGEKLGSRFYKTVSAMGIQFGNPMFQEYFSDGTQKHYHSAVYGSFCQSIGISKRDAMEAFVYAAASAMVTNCVKLVPLSQSKGQEVLHQCHSVMEQVVNIGLEAEEEDYGRSVPGFDLRCIQHEYLYSRLYMS